MANLRTILMWLDEQHISPDAEVWILSDSDVLPVTVLHLGRDAENPSLESRPVWAEPTPTPLKFGPVYDMLLATYSGGGTLTWEGHVSYTFRGSYTINPNATVFFLFLPKEIQLTETHSERLDKRKEQARQLTQEIEESWQHSP